MANPAQTYESYMVPALFAPWAHELVHFANPHTSQRVLDLACGTGIVARTVASELGPDMQITALDVSPNMLAVARNIGELEDLPIEWCQGKAEKLPFPDESFDLVLCQFALMFFSDRRRALSEIHRVLVPGGWVAFNVWRDLEHHPFYQALDEVIQRRLNMSGVRDIFAMGDRNDIRRLLMDSGFENVQIAATTMTAHFPNPELFLAGEIDVDTASIPSMQQLDDEHRKEITETIRDEMQRPLRDLIEGNEVVMPFHAYLVRAVK